MERTRRNAGTGVAPPVPIALNGILTKSRDLPSTCKGGPAAKQCVEPVGNDGKSLWIDCRKLAAAVVERAGIYRA
jgi:hypothetical protein